MLGDCVTADAETKLSTDKEIVENLIRKIIDAIFTLASNSNVLWHHSCVIERVYENGCLVISLIWIIVRSASYLLSLGRLVLRGLILAILVRVIIIWTRVHLISVGDFVKVSQFCIDTIFIRHLKGSTQPLLLIVKLRDNLETTNLEKVKYAFFEDYFIVLGVHDLDDTHDSLSVLSLQVIQIEYLFKEVSGLLVREIATILRIKGIVEDFDVMDSLFQLFLANLLNPLLVVVEYNRKQDAAHEEDRHTDENHENDNGVEVSVICRQHKVREILCCQQDDELPIWVADHVREFRSLDSSKKDEACEEGKIENEHPYDRERNKRVFDIDGDQTERLAQMSETENYNPWADHICQVQDPVFWWVACEKCDQGIKETHSKHSEEYDVAKFVSAFLPVTSNFP